MSRWLILARFSNVDSWTLFYDPLSAPLDDSHGHNIFCWEVQLYPNNVQWRCTSEGCALWDILDRNLVLSWVYKTPCLPISLMTLWHSSFSPSLRDSQCFTASSVNWLHKNLIALYLNWFGSHISDGRLWDKRMITFKVYSHVLWGGYRFLSNLHSHRHTNLLWKRQERRNKSYWNWKQAQVLCVFNFAKTHTLKIKVPVWIKEG